MAPLLTSIRCVLLFLVLIQSATLFRIFDVDDNRSNLQSDSLISPLDDQMSQALPTSGYDDEDAVYDTNDDKVKDNLVPWSSFLSDMRRPKFEWKRSGSSFDVRPSRAALHRRNYRPHWNPIVAAYKRCSALPTHQEREICFKDAIQMIFMPIS